MNKSKQPENLPETAAGLPDLSVAPLWKLDAWLLAPGFSWQRIFGMVLRYWYLLRSSWPRLVELMYWPTIQVIIWGFLTLFLAGKSEWIAGAFGILLAAVLLWDVCFRSELGFALSFLEEVWARNLGHLFVSPLRPHEFVVAMTLNAALRTVISVLPAMLICIPLYEYSIFSMGLPLLGFFVNLMLFGWSLGLVVTGLILRLGQGAESLAWSSVFLVAPASCIYYPVETLPAWLQTIALALPTTHVFEGMRGVIVDQVFLSGHFQAALMLNGLYFCLAALFFLRLCHIARARGLILNMGE